MCRRPAVVLAAALAAGSTLLAGCGNGQAQALARQACTHVELSIRLWHEAGRDPGAAQASDDRNRALDQLRAAEPLAAAANSDDPVWNPLMTTLSESSEVQERFLIQALTAQCAGVVNPSSGGASTLPQPTVPG